MQTEERLMAEIKEANLSYLILAQALIRADRAEAIFRLGISEPVADLLTALTPGQLLKVSGTSMLMFRFRFDDDMIWSLLTEHSRQSEDAESSANRLHASILMAGNFNEAVQS